jgi:hypothetical protein
MAYAKQTWIDRVVQYARRYTKTDIDTDTVELVPEPGTITQAGTAITASRMNNIENEIEFLSNRHNTTTNTGNAYILAITNTNYNYQVGHTLTFIANATNTAGATLNVNNLGAKTIKKEIEGSLIDLFYGDIAINRMYEVFYDGTYFILKKPSRRDEINSSSGAGTDAYNINLSNEKIYVYGVYNGLNITFKADVSNTGASTMVINGSSAKNIKRFIGGIKVDIETNDIVAGGEYNLVYDGTDFILLNPENKTIVSQFYNVAGTYSWITPVSGNYKLILVGGGGGGATGYSGGSPALGGGGGGASGICRRHSINLPAFTRLSITVGAGGSKSNNNNTAGNSGGTTSIVMPGIGVYSASGGGGGQANGGGHAGGTGGMAGGGGGSGTGSGSYGGNGGNSESASGGSATSYYGGGGAGISSNGSSASGTTSGSGGTGTNINSIPLLDFTGTGTSGTSGSDSSAHYGGGGGAGYGGNGGAGGHYTGASSPPPGGGGGGGGGYGSDVGGDTPADGSGQTGFGYGAGGGGSVGGAVNYASSGIVGMVLIYHLINPGGIYS